jgi:GNAT superfamily N-acetyltransferase
MPGYRFCRSDDIPLLVAAHNACWVPHFGAESAIGVDDFKRGIRELGLWSSSCMVAFEGDEPIGVLVAAKRDGEANYVHRLAVKPGWERLGHGRHLLTSLVDKAAILGPARVVAEIAAESTAARRFFERSGFVEEARYADFVLDAAAGASEARGDLVVTITYDELAESVVLADGRRAWRRTRAALRARAAVLEGLAVATDRIEAHLLMAPARGGTEREVVAIGAESSPQRSAVLAMLVARASAEGVRLRIPTIAEDELPFATLAALGFHRANETIGYVSAEFH